VMSLLRWRSAGGGLGGWRVAKRLMAGLVLSLGTGGIAAQGLPAELQQAWKATRLSGDALSLYVQEVGGPPLIAINPAVARNPASVMKMVTTWAGLSGLGPEYAWRTTFLARGGGMVDQQGTLQGPLYLKAG